VDFLDQLRIDTPEQIALELPMAGIGSRFLALAIDTLLQFALYVVGGIAFAILLPMGVVDFPWIPASMGPAFAIFFLFCVYWGYFALFEVIWKGQTPGKRYAGIRVIKESGGPINAFEAIGRNLMRAVDGLPGMYGVGLVCMMLNKQNQRLGDFVAGTIVVHEKFTGDVKPTWDTAKQDPSASPEVAKASTEELVLIETYLHRRFDLDPAVRLQTALQIAQRMAEKTGLRPEPGQHVDEFLERIARQIRDSGRF
jgi:uncharacterized RDD family membrane protein YckC